MLGNMLRGTICIEDIEVGMSRHLKKTVTDRDIEMFAEVSTDHNPVHLNEDYANETIFGGRIAHGMLTAGLISAVIGGQLKPGHGTVSFKGTGASTVALLGDQVTAQWGYTTVGAKQGKAVRMLAVAMEETSSHYFLRCLHLKS